MSILPFKEVTPSQRYKPYVHFLGIGQPERKESLGNLMYKGIASEEDIQCSRHIA